ARPRLAARARAGGQGEAPRLLGHPHPPRHARGARLGFPRRADHGGRQQTAGDDRVRPLRRDPALRPGAPPPARRVGGDHRGDPRAGRLPARRRRPRPRHPAAEMTLAAFPLFPPHGLDQTIHVPVLLGLRSLLALTETFGWVYSGLVVPGYLASVFVIQPAAGATIVGESLLTFWVARALSDAVSATGSWSRFFGRERFVLLIIVSVLVRQASQTWLLPGILGLVDARFGPTLRLEASFSSLGLVLVPLTANMFWKLDTRRGIVQVAVPTLITYALLRLVFLPLTNLTFSSIELTYENVALDFLASPKAYIVLLTGTYVAARCNLFYGWDYSGILIPALLALAAFSPWRLVSTAVEAMLVFFAVRLLLRLPRLRTANLEGPRKIALVFTVGFLLKYVLSWALAPEVSGAGVNATDLFGFGYLVPSLLAAKMLHQEQIGRTIVPTYLVAVASTVIGSIVGFGLEQVAPAAARPLLPDTDRPPPTTVLARTPVG